MAEQNNINQNVNQGVFGLNTDSILTQVKPGSLTYALNAQVDSFDGHMVTYQNEQSNVLCSQFKTGYKVIGFHVLGERTILFMVNPDTGDSEIGEISNVVTCDVNNPTHLDEKKSNTYVNNGYSGITKDCKCSSDENTEILNFYDAFKMLYGSEENAPLSCCVYKTLINARCLNFRITNPIHKIVANIGSCDTELYFTDGYNPRRFINVDSLPYREYLENGVRVKTDEFDCSLLEVQSSVKMPCIVPIVVSDGGNITAGTVQFALQYANSGAEAYTSMFSITNPVSIFEKRYGLDYNFPTNKSVKLQISNLDTKFDYFNLIVIKTVNGVSDPELVGTYEITSESRDVVYTGNNVTQSNLTMEDVFQSFPYYGAAEDVANVNGVLVWAGLKSKKRISYQSIANKIKLDWVTVQVPYTEKQAYNGVNTAKYRGQMRDEVIPYEIAFITKHGVRSDRFHIPGRALIPGTDDVVVNAAGNDDVVTKNYDECAAEETSQPYWKVYNTGAVTGLMPEYIAAPDKECYIGPYQYGRMGYWESIKTYPDDPEVWGELAGQPIRHHKFPDNRITHIYNSNPNAKDKEFEHKIFPIGVQLDLKNLQDAVNQSNLTQDEKDDIIGYEIFRGDRVNNKSVIAKGLLYNVGAYVPYSEGSPATDQESFYPNYPFNDLGNDPFLTNLSTVGDGGFSISALDLIETRANNLQQQLETVNSFLQTVPAVTYRESESPLSDVIIQITNSERNDVINKLFNAQQAGNALLTEIARIQEYYNNKVQENEVICQDDVTALTINATVLNNYINAVNTMNAAGAWTNFQNIINYVNSNANDLNDHPNAEAIFNLKNNLLTLLQIRQNSIDAREALEDAVDSYEADLLVLSSVDCDGTVNSTSAFSRSRFTFHSPDTHFYQPFLGSVLKFETLEGGVSVGNFVPVQKHAGHKLRSSFSSGIALAAGILVGGLFALEPKLQIIGSLPGPIKSYYLPPIMPSLGTIAEKALYWNQQFKTLIDNLIPYKNYAYQYNAVGYYNKFVPISNNGNKQRMLDKAYYLLPGNQAVGDIYPINNWKRESSVYFRTDKNLTAPLLPNDPLIIGSLLADNSRVSYSPEKQIYSNILSYYASHKRKLLDQWGDIYSYQVVNTGHCGQFNVQTDYTGQKVQIFGGDTFINREGFKRKLSYFIDTAVGRADGSDIEYSDLSNIGKTRYWYNTSSAQTPNSGFKGLMKSILDVPQSKFDGNTNKLFYQNGRIYLYSYGIAYYFVESEVNVDMRQAGNNADKDFFPNVGTGIPNDWLQETNVPIVHDNYYIYNKTYSKQHKETVASTLPLGFDPTAECDQDQSYSVVYSDPGKWRSYKPISIHEFGRKDGKLTSIDTINNSSILVRFENKSYIYNALTSINTSTGKAAYLGNDELFGGQSIDFGETDLGYAGSQHKFLLRTQAGHLFIDAKRGMIILVSGTSAQPISESGMSKWFQKNLPFTITKYFPEVNVDNHFNGTGITGVWDNKHSRFLITKLDYEPITDYRDEISYNAYLGKYFYKNSEILLEDPKFFHNRSWTVSYSPGTKSWISFHSYLPNYYIGYNTYFQTGRNGIFNNQKSSIWSHNLIHTSFQNFYGKLDPFVVEYPYAYKYQDELVQNVKDHTEILEYYNENDYYKINEGVYYSKAILSNGQQTSGVLNLYPKPKGQMNLYFNYPKYNTDSKDIMYTKSDNFFNYNTFWDVVMNANNHHPLWKESSVSKSVDKELNNDKLDYSKKTFQKNKLRAKDLKVRHINDKFDRYKFVTKFVNAPTQISYK